MFLGVFRSFYYIGNLIGFLGFSSIIDNRGRRFSILLTWTVNTIGICLLVFAPNIIVISIGLIMIGAGGISSNRIVVSIINESFNSAWRQKGSVGLEMLYGFGGCITTYGFYISTNWRTLYVFIQLIPCVLILLAIYVYIQETPSFLMQTDPKKALIILNKISMINFNK